MHGRWKVIAQQAPAQPAQPAQATPDVRGSAVPRTRTIRPQLPVTWAGLIMFSCLRRQNFVFDLVVKKCRWPWDKHNLPTRWVLTTGSLFFISFEMIFISLALHLQVHVCAHGACTSGWYLSEDPFIVPSIAVAVVASRPMPLAPGPSRLRLLVVWVDLAAPMDRWAPVLDRQGHLSHPKTEGGCLKGSWLVMFFFFKTVTLRPTLASGAVSHGVCCFASCYLSGCFTGLWWCLWWLSIPGAP